VRLGIFGGTFDPPHVGHLLAASDAFELLGLDRLLFVPAAVQPFKQNEVQASPQPERFTVLLNVDGKKAKLEVISASALNPLRLREMQAFRCPEGL